MNWSICLTYGKSCLLWPPWCVYVCVCDEIILIYFICCLYYYYSTRRLPAFLSICIMNERCWYLCHYAPYKTGVVLYVRVWLKDNNFVCFFFFTESCVAMTFYDCSCIRGSCLYILLIITTTVTTITIFFLICPLSSVSC